MKKSDAAALLEPATEAVTPPPTPPEAPGFVEAPAADPPAAPAVEVPAFTDAQDALILGLKALNKTWKEIGALLPDKDTEDLRDRYAELTTVKSEEKKAEDVTTEDGTEEPTEGKKGDKKKDKKNKKKGDKGETNHQEENGEEINGRSKKDKHGNEKHPRGILKPDEASSDQATAETFQGHPIIYITGDDGLSPREVSILPPPFFPPPTSSPLTPLPSLTPPTNKHPTKQLLHLSSYHQILDERKWLQLSSKLFDETGKHIVPEALKEKFRNLSLL